MIDGIEPVTLLLVALVVFVAGTIKGAIAFGFPLFATPLLAALLDPHKAVVALVIPVVVTNLLVLYSRRVGGDVVRRFLLLAAAMAPATVLGSLLLAGSDPRPFALGVGSLALIFCGLSVARVRLPITRSSEKWLGGPVGFASGLLHGATGMSGPVVAMYVDALHLDPRAFSYGVTILFTVGGVVQAASYARLGLYTPGLLIVSLILIPVGMVGQQIGFRIQDRLDPARFRQIVIAFVAASSLNLLLRGLGIG